jgi:YHS domain-containing protein
MDTTLSARSANRMRWRSAIRLLVLVALLPLGTSLPSVAAQPVLLAIKGYDPVAYFALGKPMRGLPEIEYEWNGYRYRFSRAEHRELFKADPKYYAPQFEDYCAMALAKGALVEADPENWLINEGKLYIFGKPAPAGPALFQKDLAGNIAKANQNRSLIPRH